MKNYTSKEIRTEPTTTKKLQKKNEDQQQQVTTYRCGSGGTVYLGAGTASPWPPPHQPWRGRRAQVTLLISTKADDYKWLWRQIRESVFMHFHFLF